jgi:ankyrin repeat protein
MVLEAPALAEDDVNTDASVALMVNQTDSGGRTPLSWASIEGHSDCVKLLIEADGVDVNKASNSGETPLSVASGRIGRSDCVRLLREAGGV